jgi:hypothetical protein
MNRLSLLFLSFVALAWGQTAIKRQTIAETVYDNVVTKTNADSPYTAASGVAYISCDATGGPVVINLPVATGSGREITLKKTDASSNSCTATRTGSDVIDGAASFSLTVQYTSAKVVDATSSAWHRLHVNQVGGDVSGASTAETVLKVNGNTPGATCTNQFVRSIDSSARGTCAPISGTDLPNPGVTSLGGVQSKDCTGAGHLLKINNDGTVTCSAEASGSALTNVMVWLLGKGYCTNAHGQPLAASGQSLGGRSYQVTIPSVIAISKFNYYVSTAASGAGIQMGLYQNDLSSQVCVTNTSAAGSGSTGWKSDTVGSGSAYSGGSCTIPAGGYKLVLGSDNISVAIMGQDESVSNYGAYTVDGVNARAGFTPSGVSVGSGSGASFALSASLGSTNSTWTAWTNQSYGLPCIAVE